MTAFEREPSQPTPGASATAGPALVEAHRLTKRYGSRAAVDDLTLTIRQGEIYGFLGPNGAGKTTTLRMLVGLIRPTSGSVRILGAEAGTPEGLAPVGTLIEAPAFYPYLSGRENLQVLARYAGLGDQQVAAALEVVELSERAGDRFSTYSLGMKQRLGVAAALLKDPPLLILDEPTNGLDPRGMAEMRELIRRLGAGGRTVLISSHLLGEVEQLCDRVSVIQRGRLVAEGQVSELRGTAEILVRCEPLDRAAAVALKVPGVQGAQVIDGVLRVAAGAELAGGINRALVQAEIEVRELRPLQRSLEEIFLQLTDTKEAI